MLTRRHIRVKVMQSVYALTQSKSQNIEKEEKFLFYSIDNMYNLHLATLNLLVEIHKKAITLVANSQKKYLATEQEKNPNLNFVNNRVLTLLTNNEILEEQVKQNNMGIWYLDHAYVDLLYQEIIKSDAYRAYMDISEPTFFQDRDFIARIFKEIIAPNEKLYEYIESYNLTWLDDLPIVNTAILKLLRKVKPEELQGYFLPNLYRDIEDKNYVSSLFRKTILNHEKLSEQIENKTPNWESDRIADLDAILLRMAICEVLHFPSIPVKVTINEYLEVAKEYSTAKSSVFINGILDKLTKEYAANNMLNKVGRGLL